MGENQSAVKRKPSRFVRSEKSIVSNPRKRHKRWIIDMPWSPKRAKRPKKARKVAGKTARRVAHRRFGKRR